MGIREGREGSLKTKRNQPKSRGGENHRRRGQSTRLSSEEVQQQHWYSRLSVEGKLRRTDRRKVKQVQIEPRQRRPNTPPSSSVALLIETFCQAEVRKKEPK